MLESLTTHGMMDKSRLALCALLFTVIILINIPERPIGSMIITELFII